MDKLAKVIAMPVLQMWRMAKFVLLVFTVLVISLLAQGANIAPETLTLGSDIIASTRFEPSGAVWIAEASAFLVVSDDTGFKDRDNDGKPMLFLVSSKGEVTLLEVRGGPSEVSDLEAVTRSPAKDLWLLCSQSKSKKGKRPKKRQWLIQARFVQRTDCNPAYVQVLNYASLFDRFPEALRKDNLDLEGCAWLSGALLLGVKEPQVDGKKAQVWSLAKPTSLFKPGSQCDVTTFATFSLPMGGKFGGISDLFVADGVLFILSTFPEGPDYGSLWKASLAKVGSGLNTSFGLSRIATWKNVKPEGCAMDNEGRLTIFFDMMPPSWCRFGR